MLRYIRLLPAALALAACTVVDRNPSFVDSLHTIADEREALAARLAAQKDSLAGVVLDADAFIARIDSQISGVQALRSAMPRVPRAPLESPLQEQLRAREELLGRVASLVDRAKTTAGQLAESRRREQELLGERAALTAQTERDQRLLEQFGETIRRQSAALASLQRRADSLVAETRTLGERHYRAYYIVGTERELLEKGVIEREGGANLLVARVGRTVQPKRVLETALFTAIDQRDVREIAMPDPARRYRIVSRQSLDAAEVRLREGPTFQGNLRIAEPDKFWAASRYLIVLESN